MECDTIERRRENGIHSSQMYPASKYCRRVDFDTMKNVFKCLCNCSIINSNHMRSTTASYISMYQIQLRTAANCITTNSSSAGITQKKTFQESLCCLCVVVNPFQFPKSILKSAQTTFFSYCRCIGYNQLLLLLPSHRKFSSWPQHPRE